MNYRHVYMLIIEHAKSEMKNGLRPKTKYQKGSFPEQYFEFHHILPKSIYPNWAKRKSNLVCLTAREHFFCHKLLTKIYSQGEPFARMAYALLKFYSIPHANYKITSREYEKIRIECSKANSILKKGKELSKSHREHISMSLLERSKTNRIMGVKTNWTEHQREKMSEWYSNNRKFLSERQKSGWTDDVREKFSKSKKAYFTNMSEQERVDYRNRQKKLMNNVETRKKMSLAKKGKILYVNDLTGEKHFYNLDCQPVGYRPYYKCNTLETHTIQEIKDAYKKYRENHGVLLWNDFQKAYKISGYKVNFD